MASDPPLRDDDDGSVAERMKQILDRDANSAVSSRSVSAGSFRDLQHGKTKPSSSSAFMTMSRRATITSSSRNDELLCDFEPGQDSNGDGLITENNGGIISLVSRNCIPLRFQRIKTRSGQRKALLPMFLLSLILYGTISMVVDVAQSIQSIHERMKNQQIRTDENRFPGGFHSDGSGAADRASIRTANPNRAQFQRSMDVEGFSQEVDGSHTLESGDIEKHSIIVGNIDRNYPTLEDVPAITEHILSTTFQYALEHESETQPNEIPFFWSIGGTSGRGPIGRFPSCIAKCFPNVVQAGCGGDGKGVAEDELRTYANELRVLQRTDGVRYVNVDLFTSEGVRRAAELQMMFPPQPYPVVSELDRSVSQERILVDATANTKEAVLASSQIHLMVSDFLPESMGLFAPPARPNAGVPLPRARVDALLPATPIRINIYYQHYKSKHLSGMTLLQFVTSPSIIVNNYITRILAGQWEEGSPVTEVHLEIAKNVLSRKIHLWPLRGRKDMVSNWAERYEWQKGAEEFHQNLVNEFPDRPELEDVDVGLDRMFPPAKTEDGAPPVVREAVSKPQPSELQVETNNIIIERNRFDDELYQYVMKLHNSKIRSK